MPGEPGSARQRHRGFVIGELLVAVLLLAIAVSSLAALMYSVSHRDDARDETVCVGKTDAAGKCEVPSGGGATLLKSACRGITAAARKCVDSAAYRGDSRPVTVKSKTDSASVAKKQKGTRERARPDRGFIR
jgi:hypothetical protein